MEFEPRPETIHIDDQLLPRGPWSFWREAIPGALSSWSIQFVLAWIAVCDQVVRRVPWSRVLDVAFGWSARVQAMYITHWLIVGWGVGIVGFQKLGLVEVLVAMGIVVLLTSLLTQAYPVLAARWGVRRLVTATAAPTPTLTVPDGPA